ncbi:hypothetical protein TcasGA2_TC014718 [Tribolium castaneum]|uniref:Uncharacterized protein n=1 Tax=Tribolium castaneum TaxID=7070 RepID=D6WP07_TRICA|nr:hypothetical protein TcasGA2_TC014718 [Tribolium castaneum]
METWIRNQCNFRNHRSHSFKASLKALFSGKKATHVETDPFIETTPEDGAKIWRRLSLHSFRKRREKKQEEKNKPILPAVLQTYDKQKKDLEWL